MTVSAWEVATHKESAYQVKAHVPQLLLLLLVIFLPFSEALIGQGHIKNKHVTDY